MLIKPSRASNGVRVEMWFLRAFIVSSYLFVVVNSADNIYYGAIGFPEMEENPKLVNKQNRTPIFLPAMCEENELYYPGNQKDDWICDCRPGYLYHPKTSTCWPAFRQGPCGDGHYLLLPIDSVLPTCYINPCLVDNFVMWNGKCEQLGATDPCGPMFPANVLWVNATNAALDCISLTKVQHVPGITRTPPVDTLPGGKRSIQKNNVPGLLFPST